MSTAPGGPRARSLGWQRQVNDGNEASVETMTGSDSWQIAEYDVDAYLELVQVRRAAPSLELLEELHRAHVHTLPFANVDVLLGQHPGVEPATVQQQLVARRRGGYCYEHVQLFAGVLEQLGFDVTRHLGRRRPQSSRTHMTAVVRLGGHRYLVDPGFGLSMTGPLRLADGAERTDGGRRFMLRAGTDGPVPTWTLERDGELQHVTDELPALPADVLDAHVLRSTQPESPFVRGLMVTRFTPEGHVTVTHEARTVRVAGEPTRRESLDAADTVAAVRELGVRLDEADAQRLRAKVTALRR